MAVPGSCVITSPTAGQVFQSTTGAGTATITATVTTDPATDVALRKNAGAYGTPVTSNGSGLATITGFVLSAGSNVLRARAGTTPDFLESSDVTVTVTNVIGNIGKAEDRSSQYYLNWLAGYDVSGPSLVDMKDAACQWAGVSKADFSLIGALNVKAGNAVGRWQRNLNLLLNQLARQLSAAGAAFPLGSGNQKCLLAIAQNV